MMSEKEIPFEQAFLRLEEILKKMNSGHVTLDESLALYEEADTLIALCNKRLKGAETRIETLLKKRNGELETDDEGNPRVEAFRNES